MEIWKDIQGYEGRYQISNLGKVKSLSRYNSRSERIMKSHTSDYTRVRLTITKGKMFLVHRLVAIAFIPNPKNKPKINHKNGIKTDNRAENLEWVTQKENCMHASRMGLLKPMRGSDNRNSYLTEETILEIRSKYVPFKYTQRRLSIEYNIPFGTIQAITQRLIWKHI